MPATSSSASSDVIEQMSSASSSEEIPLTVKREPIVIKGVGNVTMFGLNSRFDTEFPKVLTGRVAPEELKGTLKRINAVLRRHIAVSGRWLMCGLLFCCCSFGCSMWPVLCFSKRTVAAVEKALDSENQNLYNRLGLNWSLARRNVDGRLTEYVLLLEFLSHAPLLFPD